MSKSIKSYLKSRRELRMRKWCIRRSPDLISASFMYDYLLGDTTAPLKLEETMTKLNLSGSAL